MRILIASGVQRVREAGAAGVVFYHAEGLQKLGHQVETWFFDDVLPKTRWPARFRDLEFAMAVSRRIRKQADRFDVVNLHAPWGCVYAISRALFPSVELPPYVFTMQGSEERYVLAMKLEEQKGRADHFAWKNRVWHRLYHQTMYDFSISKADCGAVANREGWILSELKYGRAPGRVWYVPNGTETSFFQERSFDTGPAKKLLYVGTWLDRKGIFYLAEAFGMLAGRLPALTLTVAGCMAPEEAVKRAFPEQARAKVTVIPRVSREDMLALYAAHDVFVFPSLVEGMPLTMLEAMATAMPVVTTNTCGMADVIEDGINGLLVPAADSAELARVVEGVCRDTELRREMGTAGQLTARRYTWDLIARHMERLLTMAVEEKRAAGKRG
jgi:glycosyltransferase involved in cell wall biosynthesis